MIFIIKTTFMKRVNYLYKILLSSCILFSLNACSYEIQDIQKTPEKLELTASDTDIVLDANNLTKNILTFAWTNARPMSDDYVVSYMTKLDVLGNNFGSSTSLLTYEDDGVFSKSYTSEQLQNWINDKWKIAPNTPLTLQFRVVAQWQGGPIFQAPEVRTVTVNVQPIKTIVFDADKVFLDGSAVPGMSGVEINKTLENEAQYACLLNLDAGELQIPVVFNGETNYICPAEGDGTLQDGQAESVKMKDTPVSWKIEKPGEYRVVVDMKKTTVTVYSPDKALTPAVVQWVDKAGATRTTPVSELWLYGGGTSWAWWKGGCTVSQADPQILIYQTKALANGDGVKFTVYGESDHRDVSYAFTCPLTADGKRQNLSLALNTVGELKGGSDAETRNSYYKLPAGANFIILDLRNRTIIAKKK
jgi:hypothetical protein